LAVTAALQELVSRGHDFHQVVDGYPASVVRGLLAASRLQRRYRLAEQAMALSVAVTGALDLAFNQGKGKVLERWTREVLPDEAENKKGPRMTERAFSFFTSMPRRGRLRKEELNGDH
jgi:hypothetical protein